LPVWHCPSGVARLALPVWHRPSGIAGLALPPPCAAPPNRSIQTIFRSRRAEIQQSTIADLPAAQLPASAVERVALDEQTKNKSLQIYFKNLLY
jgi:hypothetical protein